MKSLRLTPRETEIMRLTILEGIEKADDIAEKLYLSPKTVKNHFLNIYRKLNVNTKTGAVVRVLSLGLVELPYVREMREEIGYQQTLLKFIEENGRWPSAQDQIRKTSNG